MLTSLKKGYSKSINYQSLLKDVPFTFQSTEKEWQTVFFVGAGLFIGSNIIFVLFGSGYVQKWNNIRDEAPSDDNLNTTEIEIIKL